VRIIPTERGTSVVLRVDRGVWLGAALGLMVLAIFAVVGSWASVVGLNVEVLRAFQAAFPMGTVDGISLLLVFGSSQVSLLLLGAAGVWLLVRGRWLVALSLGFVLVGVAIEVVLKATLGHPMVWGEFSHGMAMYPFPEVKTTVVALSSPYPSGHVLRATYLALTAVAVRGQSLTGAGRAILQIAAGLLVVGVVFGVLYLGWHWPTDALGSLALAYALTAPTRWAAGAAGTWEWRGWRRRVVGRARPQ
jgi:membrane-associated phospholipid phosphatase